MNLLIFNPETEYALATGASFYTPPAVVDAYRKTHQLLPQSWAEKGDIILVDSVGGLESEYELVDWNGLEDLFARHPEIRICPWGWNHALRRRLLDAGVPSDALPTEEYIAFIRNMAHRRVTVALNREWNLLVDDSRKVALPVELSSEADAMEFYDANPGCWMKAPWSSSGRGVINTAADMTREQVRQWCHGIIRRQGSLLGETVVDKIGDFATEWKLSGEKAEYLGLSSFTTSNRGKYMSNDFRCQSELKVSFEEIASIPLDEVVELQQNVIEKIFVGYEGFLGADMMVARGGLLLPFVEVNLRRTMGMLHIRS